MSIEYTLSIIKPDATAKNITGKINSHFEEAGLEIVGQKMLKLTRKEAEQFYAVHKERSFFNELVDFISSGRIVVQVLKGENAIAKNREIMGATNPKEAEEGTIRNLYASTIDANAVHGSDSPETAESEIRFFFSEMEYINH